MFEIFGSHFNLAALKPGRIIGVEMDMGVRDVGADDFPDGAGAEDFFEMFG